MGPGPGLAGSKPFDTLIVFLKVFLKKRVKIEDNKCMKNYRACKEIRPVSKLN